MKANEYEGNIRSAFAFSKALPGNHGGCNRAIAIHMSLIVSPGEDIAIAYERHIRHLLGALIDVLPVC